VSKVFKCFRYNASGERIPSSSLIFSLKRDCRDDVLKKCTDELCLSIQNSISVDESFIITNVPRRKSAIIKYGIDHSALLAQSVAKRLGVKYLKTLKSKAKSEQKLLTHEERLKNSNFVLITDESLKGKNIIIVDDIITTGASVGSSATLIRSLHPKNIFAASLAIAYKDDL
jgi:competence protein ComFC